MSNSVKFRKCHECGNKMVARKSHKNNNKFWACTQFPECNGTAEYYGSGAVAGVMIDVREIENGYIIRTQQKYPSSQGEDDPQDTYCKDVLELRTILGDLMEGQVDALVKKIESCDQFDEEPDPKVKKKRSEEASKGETDIKALLARARKNNNAKKKQMGE